LQKEQNLSYALKYLHHFKRNEQLKYLSRLTLLLISLLVSSCDVTESHQSRFDQPTHALLSIDDELYVSDGYVNSRIAIFDIKGTFIRSWGSKGYSSSQFNNPHGIGFLSDGTLLVCDRDNSRIQLFDKNGNYLKQWHSKEIGRPWNLVVGKSDDIYIVDGGDQDPDNPRSGIVKLDKNGNFKERFSGFGSELGQLDWAHSIAADSNDNLYIVDLKNERVQKFKTDLSNNNKYVVDSSWTLNTEKNVYKPVGIAVNNNEVFISQDGENLPLVIIDAFSGNVIDKIGANVFKRVHSISVDKHGDLWIVDVNANNILRMDRTGRIILRIGDN
jgi:DNA-binding beta-propeller fold protein YncE